MRDLPCARVRGFAGLQFTELVVRRIVGARKLKSICELQSAGNDHLATTEDLLSYACIVSSYGVASEIPVWEISERACYSRGSFRRLLRSNQQRGGKIRCTHGTN